MSTRIGNSDTDGVATTAPTRVSIVGHSYVRRLMAFSRDFPYKLEFFNVAPAHPRPNWLDLNNTVVQWHYISGGTVPRLANDEGILEQLQNFQPQVLFLQIGSNDLDGLSCASQPFNVAYSISELVDTWISDIGSFTKIFIGKLIKRRKTRTKGLSLNDYNIKVGATNVYLNNFCDPQGAVPVEFWHHKGLSNPIANIYDRDRTHLNDLGHFKLYRSIRSSVKYAMK
jgi:lysophospholipase L1-like esterase